MTLCGFPYKVYQSFRSYTEDNIIINYIVPDFTWIQNNLSFHRFPFYFS